MQICLIDASENLVMQNAAWGDLSLHLLCEDSPPWQHSQSPIRQGIRQVLAGDVPRYRVEQCSRDLRWHELVVTASLIDGQRYGVLARRDITERRHVELRHEQSENQLRTFLDSALDGVVVIDDRGRIQSVNKAGLNMFGYTAEQLVGQNVSLLMPQPEASRHDGHLQRYRETGRANVVGSTRDLLAMHRDGRCFPIELSVSAASFSGNNAFIGLIRDVSERHRVLGELRDSEARYRALLDHAPQAVIVVDELGRVTQTNVEADRLFGLPEMLHGSLIQDYCVTPGVLQRLLHTTFLLANQPALRHISAEEIAFRGVQGDFSALVSASRVQLGESRCVILSISDLSVFKMSQDNLLEARKKADDASRAKSMFLANMTHEIRTPMNSILGMVYLLLQTPLSDKQRGCLERLQLSGEHLSAIINDVLDLSKIESGKLELEEINFDLTQVLAKVESLIGALAQQKALSLTISVAEDVPLQLHGDPLRLSQVLINLAGNAVKYTDRGGINIRVAMNAEMVSGCKLRFEVQDTGPGISRRNQKKLFEAFQQGDDTQRHGRGGTGLGLAISWQLVQLMDGEISIESTLGLGSVFWFTASFGKVAPVAKVVEADTLVTDEFSELRGRKVLLAEDNPFNQYLAVELLSAVGVSVDVAGNGLEVLDLLKQHRYDCVLMDLQMPLLGGIETTLQIRTRSNTPQIPVIAMTANVWSEDQNRCLQAGINDFVGKPVNPRSFYATLTRWIVGKPGTLEFSPPAAVPAGSVLDLDHLGELLGGDPARVERFARMFLEVAERTFQEMEAALLCQDIPALAALGHRLHSSALTLGATEFAQICEQLEDCRADDLEYAALRMELLQSMGTSLRQQIETLLAQPGFSIRA